MICPVRYKDMATGAELSPKPDPDAGWGDRPPAARLEAALDTCLIDTAEAEATSASRVAAMKKASPVPALMQPLMQRLERIKPQFTCVFSCRLSWMRGWLGDRYTKREIANLFREQVARKYTDGGWGECSVDCGAPSSKMVFRFADEDDVRTKAETALRARATAALANLGDILGVERRAGMDKESTVEYLEALRMAARYMRFDLEAVRRESLDTYDQDDDYYPPFEGSPDDDNFGNG